MEYTQRYLSIACFQRIFLLQGRVKYADFHVYIQKMEALFDRCGEDASDLLDPHYTGVFRGEFELTSNMKTAVFMHAEQHSVAVKSALEFIMLQVLLVTR